jgi:hypothetical protein
MDTWEQETGEWMSEPRPYTTSECTPCGAGAHVQSPSPAGSCGTSAAAAAAAATYN